MRCLRIWIIVICGCGVLFASINPEPRARAQPIPALDRNILIADRGNNRIIEVTPDKQIVWEYHFRGLPPGHGADDAFFSPDNTRVIANLEFANLVVIIDYATRKIVWQYGDTIPGAGPGQVYRPDDSYLLPDGDATIADIVNCRVIVVSPAKKIVRQYGRTGDCLAVPGYFDQPDGATPLPNGNILISAIVSRRIAEVAPNGRIVYSFISPAMYPSDANPTPRGSIIVADFLPNGVIYELDHDGNVLWQYGPYSQPDFQHRDLDRPSLAVELPNGNVIASDDYHHRIVVIDKQSHEIVWQYGHTGNPGDGPDYLFAPDGLDWRHNGEATASGIASPEIIPPSDVSPTPEN